VTGQHLTFVNRDDQALELLAAYCELETIRVQECRGDQMGRWEALKRTVFIPVCTGTPGVGKTRFGRDAIHHLAAQAAARAAAGDLDPHRGPASTPSPDDVIEAAGSLVEETHSNVCRALVFACYHDCNLRLDCSAAGGDFDTEHDVAISLIAQWQKRFLPSGAVTTALSPFRITLLDALQYIMGHTPADGGGDGAPALLINVDQAHSLHPKSLGRLLRMLLYPLVVHQMRVFVVVTGITLAEIARVLDSGGVRAREISVPLLTTD
jgi:hypothetical protein